MNCLYCKKEFTRNDKNRPNAYCSLTCWRAETSRKANANNCRLCLKQIRTKQIYCSSKCYWTDMKGKTLGVNNNSYKERVLAFCKKCNKEMWRLPSRAKKRKYCSQKCGGGGEMTEERRERLRKNCVFSTWKGKDSPSWKGGKTPTILRLRECTKYYRWRTAVYKRDNFTCVLCQKRGGKLNADHIVSFAQLLNAIDKERGEVGLFEAAQESKELWDIKNGQTLCHPCHKLTPTYGRRYKTLLTKI